MGRRSDLSNGNARDHALLERDVRHVGRIAFVQARVPVVSDYIVLIMAAAAFLALLANAILFGASARGSWLIASWSSPAVVGLLGVAVVAGIVFVATAWLAAQRLSAEAAVLDALSSLDMAIGDLDDARRDFARVRARWIATRAG
jgi:uncharacterized integral membrane protein